MATPITKDTPRWERELLSKHEQAMLEHQERFGLLGQPMTKKQRADLQRELKKQERES